MVMEKNLEKVKVHSDMDMTPDLDLIKGSKGLGFFMTKIVDIPKEFFSKYVKDKHFLDLGCGDGRVVAHALRCGAKTFRGVDFDKKLIQSTSMQRYLKLGNLHDINFNMYDVLYYYLLSDNERQPELIVKLKNYEGIIIVYHRKITFKLHEFDSEMIKNGFKNIEDLEYLRVYKKGVKKC